MTLLTRRERDAVVALAVALLISFVAGFLTGIAGFGSTSAYELTIAIGLVIVATGSYLGYRAIRRGVGYVVARSREDSAVTRDGGHR